MLATLFEVLPLASMPSLKQLSAIVPTLVQLGAINQYGKMVLTVGHRGVIAATGVSWGGGPQSSPDQNYATTIGSGLRNAGIAAMGSIRYQVKLVASAAIILLILPTNGCITGGNVKFLYCSSLHLLKDPGRNPRNLAQNKISMFHRALRAISDMPTRTRTNTNPYGTKTNVAG